MTPLAKRLAARIAASGPITVAEFMAACLSDPEHGVYGAGDPLGARGHFTTAPEISQMFGELLGLALAQSWLDRGGPAPVTLAELGPGRGTLMADALRATRAVPGLAEALRVHLVETSAPLRGRQAEALAGPSPLWWHESVGTLPEEAPLLLIANEFFDALPIRQFQRSGVAWRERLVRLDDEGRLAFALGAPCLPEPLAPRLADTREGDIVELCPAAEAIMGEIARRIAARGGVALIIDYGGWHSLGDTLQALSRHRRVDPLAAPGEADLTAHVDFEALARAARAAAGTAIAVSELTPQGVFLERLGITARAQALARALAGPALEAHVAAHRRLTHPQEMGSLFKVLGLWRHGDPPPPGLSPMPQEASTE